MARKSANYSCGSINGPSSRSNYIKGCRCNACTTAHRKYMAEYMQRRRIASLGNSKPLTKNRKKKANDAVHDAIIEHIEAPPPKTLKQMFSQALGKKRG